MSEWWVYLVECADKSLYTGVTTSLKRRIRQHNGELVGGARYTAARRPVELVYAESSSDRSMAGKREYQLRKSPRSEKLQLAADFKLREHKGRDETKVKAKE